MANLSEEQLRALARLGAKARLEELRQEEAAIRAAFPDLFGRGRKAAAAGSASSAPSAGRRRRRRRAMSAAARKAVSERLQKYWADRRKAKK
jgi:hypothetical protein